MRDEKYNIRKEKIKKIIQKSKNQCMGDRLRLL
jgi:hypothetical protein